MIIGGSRAKLLQQVRKGQETIAKSDLFLLNIMSSEAGKKLNVEVTDEETGERKKRGDSGKDGDSNAKESANSRELGTVAIADNLPKGDPSKGSHNLQ